MDTCVRVLKTLCLLSLLSVFSGCGKVWESVNWWNVNSPFVLDVLSLQPINYWRLNELSGVTAYDLGSSPDLGTYNNGFTLGVPGALYGNSDTAVTLNGTTGYVDLPNSSSFNFDTNQDFTVLFWMKAPTTQLDTGELENSMLGFVAWTPGYPFVFRIVNQTAGGSQGEIQFARYDGVNNPSINSTVAINNSLYHFIVGIRRTGNLEIYIDGTLNGTTPDTTTATTRNTSDLQLGREAGESYFEGNLDEAVIFNYAISPTQVAGLYTAGATGTSSWP